MCADNGRPNRAVQTVLGDLLKEMFNLTDDAGTAGDAGALAPRPAAGYGGDPPPPEDATQLPVRLVHDGGRLAFQEPRSGSSRRWVYAPESRWLDSTVGHHEQHRHPHPPRPVLCADAVVPSGREPRAPRASRCGPRGPSEALLEGRSRPTTRTPASGRRGLGVCARTSTVLADGFRGPTGAQRSTLEEYRLLETAAAGAVCGGPRGTGAPERAMTTQSGAVPITLRDPKEVAADLPASPHDPGGHLQRAQRQGVRGMVAETCHAGAPPS